MNINKPIITFAGNLTDDPDLRVTSGGHQVVNFTVACTPRFEKDGQWQDGESTFLDCEIWRKQAENAGDSLRRGSRVLVNGTIRTERWEHTNDHTGEITKRSRIIVEVVEIGPSLLFTGAVINPKSARVSSIR